MERPPQNLLARIPRLLLVLDLVGSLWIGLGVWVLLTDDELPVFEGYDRSDVGAGFVLVGVVLMVPFVAVLIRTALSARTPGGPTS